MRNGKKGVRLFILTFLSTCSIFLCVLASHFKKLGLCLALGDI